MKNRAHSQSLIEAQHILNGLMPQIEMDSRFRRLHETIRNDADPTNALALQLEQMKTRVVEYQYSKIQAREIIPISTELSPWADTFSWRENEWVGTAQIISRDVTDLPSVAHRGGKLSRSQVTIADMVHYSIFDVMKSMALGQPLDAMGSIAAKRAAERLLDEVLAVGAPNWGIPSGFVNDGDVAVTAGGALSAFAADLAQLNGMANNLVNSSDEAYADQDAELILPRSAMQTLSQTRASGDNSETTLDAFLKSNPWVRSVRTWQRLQTAGVSASRRAVLWYKRPEVAEGHVSAEFTMLPAQTKALGFDVPGYLMTAGTTVYQPLAMRYLDGI